LDVVGDVDRGAELLAEANFFDREDTGPVGRSNSPTFGHFKFPHPDERLMAQ
jgi:hypothetical protein